MDSDKTPFTVWNLQDSVDEITGKVKTQGIYSFLESRLMAPIEKVLNKIEVDIDNLKSSKERQVSS